jgi:deoxyribonuclease-4
MSIKFGPAGIGGINEIPQVLELYHNSGIKAAEIPFTYQVWIKDKETADKIKKTAKNFGISLSIHAPYFINLNSNEKEKIESSKKRILRCCEVASWLDAKKVVFHCGFYGKMKEEETYQNIKLIILEMQETIKKNKWDVELCPEVMGKKNVFGSIDEISRLAEETKCSFCIDLAHTLARYNNYNMELLKEKFPQKKWHCHFSGIEYGEKGEKKHILTDEKEIKKIFSILPKDKDITIINESPSPMEDTLLSIRLHK